MKSLKEVEKIVGLKRRAIQEYEVAGLAKRPSHKNKYGYLLYEEREIERLWQLRFYKELGYNITKIKQLEQDKAFDFREEMEKVIKELEEKREQLDNMIAIARMMKDAGVTFNTLRHSAEVDGLEADNVFGIIGTALNFSEGDEEENIYREVLTDEDYNNMFELAEAVILYYDEQLEYTNDKVQALVKEIHRIAGKAFSESILFFKWNAMVISPDGEVGKELIEEIGEVRVYYLWNAIQHYCLVNADNDTDRELYEAIETVEKLARKKYTAGSKEVQQEIKRIHLFYSKISIIAEEAQLDMVRRLGKLYGSKAYKKALDHGSEQGVAWFLSRAIEIYCDRQREQKQI